MMSELREWLESEGLDEEHVTVKGKVFLVKEIDMATRSRTLAGNAKDGDLPNEKAEALMMSMSVCDPETGEPLVPVNDHAIWLGKGCKFAPLLRAVLRVNGMASDEVGDEVKNSDATTG